MTLTVLLNPARKRVRALGCVLFMLLACGAQAQTLRVDSLEGRNLVIVVVDSLRADHLGCYGYTRPTSPFVDSLAKEGLTFTDAAANSSYIAQSLSTLFTGRLPTSGGTIGMDEAHPLDNTRTLPVIFRRSGYRTGIATNQFLIEGRGFTKGFDDVQIGPSQDGWSAAETSRRALDFVDSGSEKPFVLYVHYAEPHQPYTPTPDDLQKMGDDGGGEALNLSEFRERYREVAPEIASADDPRVQKLIAQYDAEIAAADRAIEDLVQGLEERGLADNTVVVVTSSHGEEFLEHGYVGHAWTLYEEVLRVPLIVWAPGAVPAGRIEAPVSHVDLLPTFIELLGLTTRRSDFDGEPLFAADRDSFSFVTPRKPRIAELVIPDRCVVRSVTHGGWKYVAAQNWAAPADRYAAALFYMDVTTDNGEPPPEPEPAWAEIRHEELFRLSDDPREQKDRASENAAHLDRLRAALDAYRDFCAEHALEPRPRERRAPILEMEQTEDLESLGYL